MGTGRPDADRGVAKVENSIAICRGSNVTGETPPPEPAAKSQGVPALPRARINNCVQQEAAL